MNHFNKQQRIVVLTKGLWRLIEVSGKRPVVVGIGSTEKGQVCPLRVGDPFWCGLAYTEPVLEISSYDTSGNVFKFNTLNSEYVLKLVQGA